MPPNKAFYRKLDQCLNDPDIRAMFTNNQTRHIAVDVDVFDIYKRTSELYFEYMPEFQQPLLSDNELLSTAKDNLSQFAFCTTTDRLDSSFGSLCKVMNWPFKGVPKRVGISKQRIQKRDLPNTIIDQICDITKLDRQLYEFASSLCY